MKSKKERKRKKELVLGICRYDVFFLSICSFLLFFDGETQLFGRMRSQESIIFLGLSMVHYPGGRRFFCVCMCKGMLH